MATTAAHAGMKSFVPLQSFAEAEWPNLRESVSRNKMGNMLDNAMTVDVLQAFEESIFRAMSWAA